MSYISVFVLLFQHYQWVCVTIEVWTQAIFNEGFNSLT